MANANKMLIPNDVLEELKCALCSHYLSVPTVTLYHIKEGCYVCGRCTGKFQNQGGIRASAYEAVARLLFFPCRFSTEGCKQQLPWGTVLDHESSCEYRSYECPSLPRRCCTWTGPVKNLALHFKEIHRSLYMDVPNFQLPLDENVEMNKLMFVLNETFLIQIISEVKKFCICVKYVGKSADADRFVYEIEMRANTQDSFLKICTKTTKPALKFDVDRKDMNEIDVSSLVSILKTRDITCNVNILQKEVNKQLNVNKPEPQQEQEAGSVEDKAMPIDKNLLMELECPICQEYMVPPIFICSTGHSICSNCKEKIYNCPSCYSSYSGARNYTLEKLTAIVNYPCRNESRGCKFVGPSTETRSHENNCRLSFIKCPLEISEKCSWRGSVSDLKSHSLNCHRENTWIKLNESLFRNLTSTVYADFHIITFEDELFKICCKHSRSANGPVQWSFQHIGLDAKDKPKFKFEIEFVDVNDRGRKFIINDLCYSLTEGKDPFERALSIPNNLLSPFVNKDSCLIFKYDMSRI